MNQRENALEMINWGKPEYVPNTFDAYHIVLLATGITDQPWRGGVDPFGVNWIATPEGAIPEPNKFLFDDIADWKNFVKFPDVDKFDFTQVANIELGHADRNEKVMCMFNACGLFERLVAFMGFENALCALVEDPDSCKEFFDAFSDYKVATIGKAMDVYKPDIVMYYDDIATARGLFMSPQTYREVIKPYHRKISEYVVSRGCIFEQHTCGKCEEVLEDFVEIGAKIWNPAQICNNIPEIQKKFKGRLIVNGGWDSQGSCALPGADAEALMAEARRCMNDYGKNGGYMIYPLIVNENGLAYVVGDERLPALTEEWYKINKL